MTRGLDHIVHAVHDLEAVAAFYARAGFSVGARNQHPWGTHNRIVQLPGFFIELLTLAEPDKIVAHGARSFSFGAFQRDYLASGQGLSMLLLQSTDAAADAAAFAAAGIGDFDTFGFAREGQGPDGTPVQLGFSLAFAADPDSPRAGFGCCRHHHPEQFWNPARQQHANGVAELQAVLLIADNPTDHHIFLSALTGQRDLHSSSVGVSAATPNGAIEILEPISLRDQLGVTLEADGAGMTFAGLRFGVDDIEACAALLEAAAVPFTKHRGWLVVAPEQAFGATLVFAPRRQS